MTAPLRQQLAASRIATPDQIELYGIIADGANTLHYHAEQLHYAIPSDVRTGAIARQAIAVAERIASRLRDALEEG